MGVLTHEAMAASEVSGGRAGAHREVLAHLRISLASVCGAVDSRHQGGVLEKLLHIFADHGQAVLADESLAGAATGSAVSSRLGHHSLVMFALLPSLSHLVRCQSAAPRCEWFGLLRTCWVQVAIIGFV